MKPLRGPNQRLLLDPAVIAYWQGGVYTGTSRFSDVSAGSDVALTSGYNGPRPGTAQHLFIGTEPDGAWNIVASVGSGIVCGNPSNKSNALMGDLTVSAWINLDILAASGLRRYVYGAGVSGVPANNTEWTPVALAVDDLGQVVVPYDTKFEAPTVVTFVNQRLVVGVTYHIAVTRRVGVHTLYIDGRRVEVRQGTPISPAAPPTAAAHFIGAPPGFTISNDQVFDGRICEVAVLGYAASDNKVRMMYADNVRPWSERELIDNQAGVAVHRVLVERMTDEWIDLSDFYGTNWCQKASIARVNDQPMATANISLLREIGKSVSLANLNLTAENNRSNGGIDFTPVIELRRHVRIERAYVPEGWALQGWEWEEAFDGYIDSFDWSEESVDIKASDRRVGLADAFRMSDAQYLFYDAPVVAEEHMQTIIDANVPSGPRGYIGGRPDLFVPSPSNWRLRYDDSGASPVADILDGLAAQIGWDMRFKRDWGRQEDRLTFSEPPRFNRNVDGGCSSIGINGAAHLILRLEKRTAPTFLSNSPTWISHGLAVGQTVTVASAFFSGIRGGFTVASISGSDEVLLAPDFGMGSGIPTCASVALTWAPHVTISSEQIRTVERLSLDVESIRNSVLVRFRRSPDTATLPVITADRAVSGGFPFTINVVGTYDADDLPADSTVSLRSNSVAAFNGDWTVLNVAVGAPVIFDGLSTPVPVTVIRLQEAPATVATGDGGRISSDTIASQSLVLTATSSRNRYGLRACAIYEDSSSHIDSFIEAMRLGSAVLSDLADPDADVDISVPWRPDIELHDLLLLGPDGQHRWTGVRDGDDLKTAVISLTESFSGDDAELSVGLRSAGPSLGYAWAKNQIIGRVGAGSFPTKISIQTNQGINNVQARQAGGQVNVRRMLTDTDNVKRVDSVFFYAGTTTGFRPPARTMTGTSSFNAGLTRALPGQWGTIDSDFRGDPLLPGTTYYLKYQERDITGRASVLKDLGQVNPRYTVQNTVSFHATRTATQAFNTNDSASGFYNAIVWDRLGNYTTLSGFFRAPVSGMYALAVQGVMGSGAAASKDEWRETVALWSGPTAATASTRLASMRTATSPLILGTVRFALSANAFLTSGAFVRMRIGGEPDDVGDHRTLWPGGTVGFFSGRIISEWDG